MLSRKYCKWKDCSPRTRAGQFENGERGIFPRQPGLIKLRENLLSLTQAQVKLAEAEVLAELQRGRRLRLWNRLTPEAKQFVSSLPKRQGKRNRV